jgi:prepilin peptidase CpaA
MHPLLNAAEWQWAYGLTLSIFMLIASAEDIKRKRIPNHLILGMLCSGLVLNALGPLGARMALLGSLMGMAVLFPLYLLRAFGAGDIKLMAALGSFFGPLEIIQLTLLILVIGGCFAGLRLLWIDKTRLALANIAGIVSSAMNHKAPSFDPSTQSIERMPFVPAMAVGVLVYGFWR